MEHSFDIEIAIQYGVNAAILFQNILFWIMKNEANDKHFHDGKHWTYNSVSAFAATFPYLTQRQIQYALQKLIRGGMLTIGNFNDNAHDRTLWFTVGETGEAYHKIKSPNFKSNPIAFQQKSGGVCYSDGIPNYEELDRIRRQRNGTG